MLYDDTIAAIATPSGTGGIGIVRLSGPQALPVLERLFVPRRPGRWRSYRLRMGRVVGQDGAVLDEALAVYMRGPRSFTAEDVVEISCHGSPLILGQVMELALAAGARPAQPGEFTMRAFLHGRIDLSQAEATLDLIQARTSAELALAQAQLDGWLARRVRAIRALLIEPLAYVTALVDFPEDELDDHPIEPAVQAALAAIEQLLATARRGMIYRQGAR